MRSPGGVQVTRSSQGGLGQQETNKGTLPRTCAPGEAEGGKHILARNCARVRHHQSASGAPLCNLLFAHNFLYLLALPVMTFVYGVSQTSREAAVRTA